MSDVRGNAGDVTAEDERVQIGPRLPRPLVERLRLSAERNGRTFNRELEIALNEYVGREEQELPPELLKAVESYLKRQERQRQPYARRVSK